SSFSLARRAGARAPGILALHRHFWLELFASVGVRPFLAAHGYYLRVLPGSRDGSRADGTRFWGMGLHRARLFLWLGHRQLRTLATLATNCRVLCRADGQFPAGWFGGGLWHERGPAMELAQYVRGPWLPDFLPGHQTRRRA